MVDIDLVGHIGIIFVLVTTNACDITKKILVDEDYKAMTNCFLCNLKSFLLPKSTCHALIYCNETLAF